MSLDPDVCYRALTARDPRFDGLFFVAVTSTRIYCRPICPARTPGRDRCRFFPSAAAAEHARFRPCLRCRPELAPGLAPVDAVGRTARLAAARIGAGVMNDEGGLEALAEELGVGSRHLRRVLRQELAVSPVELAQTHRLLLAKQLLTETSLPIIDVAFASGFASVRRFNALFRSRYRLTPSDLRKTNGKGVLDESIRLTLSYRPPFAWDSMLQFLASRALNGVEAVVDGSYLRTVEMDGLRGWVKVRPAAGRHALTVELPMSLIGALPFLLGKLRNLFDLDAHPDVIANHLGCDPHLSPGLLREPGLQRSGAFWPLALSWPSARSAGPAGFGTRGNDTRGTIRRVLRRADRDPFLGIDPAQPLGHASRRRAARRTDWPGTGPGSSRVRAGTGESRA